MAKYVAVRVVPRGVLLDGETSLILNGATYDTKIEAEERAQRQKDMDKLIGPKQARYWVLELPDGCMLEE